MKIQFAGVGSAFTSLNYFQSNMLLGNNDAPRMLIDCGTDCRHALRSFGIRNNNITQQLDAVYISHLHADHIGGLEWLALCTYFNPKMPRLKLYAEETLMKELWQNSLKGGLGMNDTRRHNLDDYFDCRPLQTGVPFFYKQQRLTIYPMIHVKGDTFNRYSYGLLIKDAPPLKHSFFLTTDTCFHPAIINGIGEKVDLIFHDCETGRNRSGVHAHYEDLLTLPAEIRAKIWLYHYQEKPPQNPTADGFCGFVQRGQLFDSEG